MAIRLVGQFTGDGRYTLNWNSCARIACILKSDQALTFHLHSSHGKFPLQTGLAQAVGNWYLHGLQNKVDLYGRLYKIITPSIVFQPAVVMVPMTRYGPTRQGGRL